LNDPESERYDGLEHFYHPVKLSEKWTSILFWISAFLSFTVIFTQQTQMILVYKISQMLFAICVTVHLLLSLSTKLYLIPRVEGMRRKQLLSNSFSVPLTPEQTRIYYNNPLAPSIHRLGANILENSYFAKAVCGRMATRGRVKMSIYFILWLVVVFLRSTPAGILVIVTQIVFSGELIAKQASIEMLRQRNENLYSELYQQFLHKVDFKSATGTACILDAFATYEAVKAAAAIKQSSSIFHDLNPRLSKEWDDICCKLGIVPDKEESNAASSEGCK